MEAVLIGTGAQARVFRVGARAVKQFSGDKNLAEIYMESLVGTLVHQAGLPVPEVLGVTTAEDERSIQFRLIEGRSLDSRLREVPASSDSWIRSLARLHWQIHAAAVSVPRCQREVARDAICSVRMFNDDLRQRLLRRLQELPVGTSLCHGDFHPHNILVTGDILTVIDWASAVRGCAAADVCQTYLLLKLHWTRLAEAYLTAYCDLAGMNSGDVQEWLPIVIAMRLALHRDDEIQPLLRLLFSCEF